MEIWVFHLIIPSLAISEGAKILGIFTNPAISHYRSPEAVLKTLASNGHQVTSISIFPQKEQLKNFRDIDVSKVIDCDTNSQSLEFIQNLVVNPILHIFLIGKSGHIRCESIYSAPQVRNLLNEKFDLVITELFGSDCHLGFAWKFNAPLISIIAGKHLPWSYSRVGNPFNPAITPIIFFDYPSPMSFIQRLTNTYYYLLHNYNYETFNNGPTTDEISKKLFGLDVPSVNNIILNTSLVFVNSHHTIDAVYPMVPNLIEIGGIHIDEIKPLSDEIRKFMDEAENGVIYFTFGSIVRTSTLRNETIEAFKECFAQLPVRVIWKFETEMNDIPSNVLIGKWFPQSDILAHKNIKAFITHGGQSGTIEAVHYAVPLIGIPLFGDQRRNIKVLVDKGAAIKIEFNELTKDKIYDVVKTVLFDKSYTENMKALSKRFKDRPMTPAQTVVYWTEYVLRHKGAHHLQTSAIHMPWYQYLLLDVIIFIIIVLSIILLIIYYFIKMSYNFIKNLFIVKKTKSE